MQCSHWNFLLPIGLFKQGGNDRLKLPRLSSPSFDSLITSNCAACKKCSQIIILHQDSTCHTRKIIKSFISIRSIKKKNPISMIEKFSIECFMKIVINIGQHKTYSEFFLKCPKYIKKSWLVGQIRL